MNWFVMIMGIGMTIILTLIILFVILYITEKREVEKDYDRFVQQAMSKPKEEKAVGDEVNDNNPICLDDRTTTGLVLNTLGSIGCDPEIEEHDNLNWISFTYQGEHFKIQCSDDCRLITIYDTWWYQISIYSDVEEIAELHKAINFVNQNDSCTLVYTTNKEIEQIGVHSKKEILFIKEIPNIDKYLIATLINFFKIQRLVLAELEKCKVTEPLP